ncbi:unnamed protein product [Arctia plantaginis]|uniref:Carboxypeptidase n=1 Tax=Arctia plantaginis TaxID=874455 RepID=A0A8S0ZAU0_ARCPL|nr:unnamed protein product [Arctia plantaginis]
MVDKVNDTQDKSSRLSFRTPQELNRSNTVDDEFNRARLRQHISTDSRGSYRPLDHSPSLRSQPKQHTKEGEKPKHRFLIEKQPNASKYHPHKSHNRIDQTSDNKTEDQNTPDQETTEDSEEPKKKIKTESRPNQIEEKDEKLQTDQGIAKKGHQRIQSDNSKMTVRASRYRDSAEKVRIKKNRFKQSTSISAYEKNTHFGSDRLNPYAINEQMMRFMDKQKDKMNITMEVIGRTAEYNNIILLKITEIKRDKTNYFRVHKYADEAPEKKIIFIVHGLAVRGMGVLMDSEAKFATLMSFYATHLQFFDIFVIPIANPDGFTAVLNGDAILYPRGYTTAQMDDDKYIDIKGELEESLKNATFKIISVAVETLHSWYGIVTGSSVDYASSVYGIPYAMEFCMQIFENLQEESLNQIWRRVVAVVFKNIWKGVNTKNND